MRDVALALIAAATPPLTDDDRARLIAIVDAVTETPTIERVVDLIDDYWRIGDRATRTPRHFLYMHLGILIGAIDRYTGRVRRPLIPGPERPQ